MVQPAATSPKPTDRVSAALRRRDHVDRLGVVLEVIALDALGRGSAPRPEPWERSRTYAAIEGPVAAATDAAIDRLVAELTREFDGDGFERHRADDERWRVEFGYD